MPGELTRPDATVPPDGAALPHDSAQGRVRAQLLTLLHLCGPSTGGPSSAGLASRLTALERDAVTQLGATSTVTLRVRCALEEALDATRTVEASARAWSALYRWAGQVAPEHDPAVMRIRSFAIRHQRLSGGPAELDLGVESYEEQWLTRLHRLGAGDARTHITRANLAIALRDRGGEADFVRAMEILRAEVHERTEEFGPHDPFTWTAQVILAQTALRQAEALLARTGSGAASTVSGDEDSPERQLCEQAADIVEPLLRARRRRFGTAGVVTLQAMLVSAHARILLGEHAAAAALVRQVRAVAARGGIWLPPGWTDYLLARSLAADDPAALDHARTSLRARRAYYPPQARPVREAAALVARLEQPGPAEEAAGLAGPAAEAAGPSSGPGR